MTDTNARTTVNVLLASAGVAAAYVIVTRPPLRRLAFRKARLWLGAWVPAYLADQVRRAWLESNRPAEHNDAGNGAAAATGAKGIGIGDADVHKCWTAAIWPDRRRPRRFHHLHATPSILSLNRGDPAGGAVAVLPSDVAALR